MAGITYLIYKGDKDSSSPVPRKAVVAVMAKHGLGVLNLVGR